MEISSPRFKALIVVIGLSFWFFLITSTLNIFSFEMMTVFIIGVVILTQIFAVKITKLLDLFALFNTKIFLGILYVFIFSIYGIYFRLLKIDLLRLENKSSYWLDIDYSDNYGVLKQY